MQDPPPTAPPPLWPARLGTAALLGLLAVTPLLFWTSASEFFEWPKLMATRLCAIAIVVAAAWEITRRRGPPSPYPPCPEAGRRVPFAARTGEGNNGHGRGSTSTVRDAPRDPVSCIPKAAPLDAPVLLYLGFYAASTALSLQPLRSLGLRSHDYGGLASVLAAASAYLAVRLWVREAASVRRLLGWACDAGILIALYAFAQRMGIDRFLFRWALPSEERVFSTFGSPNYYAGYLCLLIPVSVALAETATYDAARVMGFLRSIFFVAVLVLTFSRAGWIGVAVAGASYAVLRRRLRPGEDPERASRAGRQVLLGILAIAAIVLVAGWSEVRARLESAARWKGSTLESRWLAWRTVPEIVADDPWLGTGPETFLSTFAKRRPEELNVSAEWSTRPAQAHNEFLHLLSTTGILGLGAFLGLLAVWAWRVVWPRAGAGEPLRIGLSAAIVGFLVQASAGFSTAGSAPLFWAFLAMGQVLVAGPCPPPTPAEGGRPNGTAAAVRGRLAALSLPLVRGGVLAFAVLATMDLSTGLHAERTLALGNESARAAEEAAGIGRPEVEAREADDAVRRLSGAVALDLDNDAAWRTMAEAKQRLPEGGSEARYMAGRARQANPFESENPRVAGYVRFVSALALGPTDPAMTAERLRLLRETEDLYRTAWEMEPSRVILPFQFAVVCAEAGDLHGAEALCREVERLKPDYPAGYVMHGDVCLRLGRADDARRLVDQALALDPAHAQANALRRRLDEGH